MKVNKEEVKKLAEKSDRELWESIREMARSKGYNLPDAVPSHDDIEKIRRAMLGFERISLKDASKIMQNFKKNNRT
jgi:hypothetical protein